MRIVLAIFVLTVVALAAAKPSIRREKARATLVKQLRNLKAAGLNHHARTVGKLNPFRRAEGAKNTELSSLTERVARLLKSGKSSQFKRSGGGSQTEDDSDDCPELPQVIQDCINSGDEEDFITCFDEEFWILVERLFDFYADQTGGDVFTEDESYLLDIAFGLADGTYFEYDFGELVEHVIERRFTNNVDWANVSPEDLGGVHAAVCSLGALEEELHSRFFDDWSSSEEK